MYICFFWRDLFLFILYSQNKVYKTSEVSHRWPLTSIRSLSFHCASFQFLCTSSEYLVSEEFIATPGIWLDDEKFSYCHSFYRRWNFIKSTKEQTYSSLTRTSCRNCAAWTMWKQKILESFPRTKHFGNQLENPLMWISKFWLEFESLLLESVQRNSRSALLHLLEYEERLHSLELVPKAEHFEREKDSSQALILAAREGKYQLMKLFIDKQYSIAPPHPIDCFCLKCQDNKLGQSKKRLESLQALSNPLWIALTSEDPFFTAFKLCASARKFGVQDDCFESSYRELSEANQKFALGLLDEVERWVFVFS